MYTWYNTTHVLKHAHIYAGISQDFAKIIKAFSALLDVRMIRSLALPSSLSTLLLEANELQRSRSSARHGSSATICCSSRSHAYIPKLEPFSRSKFDRVLKDPPLIQKSESELADYCSTLEGDTSYSCWKAYFELKDLERDAPKEDVERVILQAGGVKSLMGCLHGISEIHKGKRESNATKSTLNAESTVNSAFPVPDGLPKLQEEIEGEERGRMLDSPYTRLLRAKGRFPAWYSPAPDHETD